MNAISMNKINNKKLLNTKWTAIKPVGKERHFIVTELKFDENNNVTHCLIEAVISNQPKLINWIELKSSLDWLQGWK